MRCFSVFMFCCSAVCCCALAQRLVWADEPVDFNREIRPIIALNCLACHGPDDEKREAGLRLDVRDVAIGKDTDSGEAAIVPGKPDESELIRHINATDDSQRMPPVDSGKKLTDAERELLRRWIAEGAAFNDHWSFVKPVRHPLPPISQPEAALSPLDRFVIARLEKENLSLSPQADRYLLARRVAIDLTGLPPTVEMVDEFVNDQSPDAYENYVDRVLAQPSFGERWARVWLDLARYADSQGYAQDSARVIWRYRDWVIQAINDNMPFDQFTIEQIAGDMLPNPTDEQKIATAFHRNTMTNSEGGTDDEEFRNAAIVDRVNTTMQVWMGMTMGCAQCHTHKYDPITQEEYFKFFAIFNQSEDADRGDESPNLAQFAPDQEIQRANLQKQIAAIEAKIKEQKGETKPLEIAPGPLKTRFVRVQQLGAKQFLHLAEVQVFVGEENVALKGEASQSSTDYDGPAKYAIDGNTDGAFASKSTTHTAEENNPWWEVELKNAVTVDKINIWNRGDNVGNRLNNWRVVLLDEKRQPLWIFSSKEAPNLNKGLNVAKHTDELTDDVRKQLAEYNQQSAMTPEEEELKKVQAQLAAIQPVNTPVMRELPKDKQRVTKIQLRGDFKITTDEVGPGLPKVFPPLADGTEVNRLALAQWLVDAENPLTARVVVNRFWEHLFGYGIVETTEDFGTQGELPTHPELLDYLAVELVQHGWDTKWLLKEIVTSATYRQSSRETPELLEKDPRNQLLARGPRFRLSAETIRDQALAIGGLLSSKMNGPSVRPPQPKLGISAAFGGSTDWDPSPGEDKYRRGLYTSWRRTAPYPSMITFDASSREVCTIRRIRTNTPLQALVTMNDPVYVEAAQSLARLTLQNGGADDQAKLVYSFRRTLLRPPTDQEVSVLNRTLDNLRQQLAVDAAAAKELATMPLGPLPEGQDVVEAAAWTVVGNILLNLDETLARP